MAIRAATSGRGYFGSRARERRRRGRDQGGRSLPADRGRPQPVRSGLLEDAVRALARSRRVSRELLQTAAPGRTFGSLLPDAAQRAHSYQPSDSGETGAIARAGIPAVAPRRPQATEVSRLLPLVPGPLQADRKAL